MEDIQEQVGQEGQIIQFAWTVDPFVEARNSGAFDYRRGIVEEFYLRREGSTSLPVENNGRDEYLLEVGSGLDIQLLDEHQLISPIREEDIDTGFWRNGEGTKFRIPRELEQFSPPGLIRAIAFNVDRELSRLHHGAAYQEFDCLFGRVETFQQDILDFFTVQYHASTARNGRNGEDIRRGTDVKLTLPYSSTLINSLRNFVKFLEALARYSVGVLATKQLLVEELNIIEGDNLINAHQVTEAYIRDLSSNYRFTVLVTTYHSHFNRHLEFFATKQFDWEYTYRRVKEQHFLFHFTDIARLIESYVGENAVFILEPFTFEPPWVPTTENGWEENRVGRDEDISGGYWSVSTIKGCLEAYRQPYAPSTPDYWARNWSKDYQHLVSDCIREIRENIECLSFEPILEDNSGQIIGRSAFADYEIYSHYVGHYWGEHIGFSTPYSWFGGRLLAIFEEEQNVLEESDVEEDI